MPLNTERDPKYARFDWEVIDGLVAEKREQRMKIFGTMGLCIIILVVSLLHAVETRAAESGISADRFFKECIEGISDPTKSLTDFQRSQHPLVIPGADPIQVLFLSPGKGGKLRLIQMFVQNGSAEPGMEIPAVSGICLSQENLLIEKSVGSSEPPLNPGDIPINSGSHDKVTIQFDLDTSSLPHHHWIADTDGNGNPLDDHLAQDSASILRYKHSESGPHPPGRADWPRCARPKIVSLFNNNLSISFPFSGCGTKRYDYEYTIRLKLCAKGTGGTAAQICVEDSIDPRIINRPT